MQDQSAILEGSLWRAVPRFALSVAATSILEQLSSLIDVVMIGHFSGEGGELGMAAVGANTPIMSLGATAALRPMSSASGNSCATFVPFSLYNKCSSNMAPKQRFYAEGTIPWLPREPQAPMYCSTQS